MSVPPVSLRGVRAKLERADKHIADLAMLTEPLAQRATDSIVREEHFKVYFETCHPRFVYRVTRIPEVDALCSTLVGDALYNMRSALDHLAAQLAFRDGVLPDDLANNAYFPIHGESVNAKGNPRHIGIPGVTDAKVIDALKDIQPYQALEDYGHAVWNQALWLVNKLCNIDKHRLLLVMVHRLDMDAPNFPWWEGTNVAGFNMTLKPLAPNDVIAWFDFRGVPDANFDPHISLAVSLDEGPPGSWPRSRSIAEFLSGLRHSITSDINWRFLHFFPDEPMIVGPK